MLFKQRRKCFCAFCKAPRHIYTSKYLGVITITGLASMSLILTFTIWNHLDIRGIFIFLPLLLIGELFSQVKWRQSMICMNCGFDVVMYRKDPEKCGEKIREYLTIRSERPEFLLRSIHIPPSAYGKPITVKKTTTTSVDVEQGVDKKGKKLSLQV